MNEAKLNPLKPTRPVVHYHGGKWRIAPWIISHFPKHRVYVEPFGGAASVLLRKPRAQVEYYNDLDGEIVNVFRTLREKPTALIRKLKLTPYSRSEFSGAYDGKGDQVERARKTIVKAFMGYGGNGICKRTGFRSKTSSNRSHAASWTTYPEALHAAVDRFRGVIIENCDAFELMQRVDDVDVLHFVDPPYLPRTRDAGTDYRCELTESDHHRLAKVLHSLKGTIVLCGYPDPLYDELFPRWETATRPARAASSGLRTEKVWIRPSKR